MKSSYVLKIIENNMDEYSASYRRIAEVILEQPEKIVRMSISKLSQLANVSDPTIMRFCAMLGFPGFKDFKLHLAKELALKENYVHWSVEQNGNPDSYIRRVGIATISTLNEVLNSINEDDIEELVEILSNAKKIEFWVRVPLRWWHRTHIISSSEQAFHVLPHPTLICSACPRG